MKRTSILLSVLFLFCAILQLYAGIPPGYYDQAEGTKKSQLKTALHQIIKDANVLKYGSGDGYTWQGFYQTDNAGNGLVLDRYSNEKRYFDSSKSVSGMHIEHSFANSWWGGLKNQAYKDLHHLYPADGTANMRKSNHPIGVVTEEVGTPNQVIKVGWSTSRPGERIKAWEPADEYKGDFARTYMYMVTCYEDYAGLWKSEGLNMLDNNTYPVFEDWVIKMLLKWNEEDEVNDLERDRNEVVYSIQGNRNPFIDHPELAEYIWGKDTATVYYTQVESVDAEIFVPAADSEINLGLQALSVPVSKDIMVRGRNLKGDLTISISNSVFTLSKTKFTAEEVQKGAVLKVDAYPQSAGIQNSVLTLIYDGKQEQVNLKADFWDGIPAYQAKDIICNPYQRTFVASWMAMPGVTDYELRVYTHDGKNLPGYPKTVSNAAESKVTGLAAETQYFYTIKAAGLNISNEVSVIMPKVKPDFSVKDETLTFTSIPQRPSGSIKVEPTIVGTETAILSVSTSAPFEVSATGETWSNELMLDKASSSFYIRMGVIDEEGDYEEEAILKTQGAEDIIITLVGNVDRSKAFFEDFENASKNSYAAANVVLPSCIWKMEEAMVGSVDNDKKNGSKSVRLRHNSGVFGNLEMLDDKVNGIGTLSFYAGAYGSDAAGSVAVEYSIDGGVKWTTVPNGNFTISKEWLKYNLPLNIDGAVRIRIKKTDASSSSTRRINIDDIAMSDFGMNVNVDEVVRDTYNVYTQNRKLIINSEVATDYTVYSLQGIQVCRGKLNIGKTECLLESGAYVIRIGNHASVICL